MLLFSACIWIWVSYEPYDPVFVLSHFYVCSCKHHIPISETKINSFAKPECARWSPQKETGILFYLYILARFLNVPDCLSRLGYCTQATWDKHKQWAVKALERRKDRILNFGKCTQYLDGECMEMLTYSSTQWMSYRTQASCHEQWNKSDPEEKLLHGQTSKQKKGSRPATFKFFKILDDMHRPLSTVQMWGVNICFPV